MIAQIIRLAFLVWVIWLIRRDAARRDGISGALWIPTLWVGILASRPLSMWFGFGGGIDTLEGSPVDRLFYFGMILASWYVLSQRNIDWGLVFSRNWPIFIFYGYFLVSVLWADSPIVSFKRWFKDFGNIFVALVILTEKNPLQAFRAVFVRCAYVLLPLSLIYIRWFPELGRRYSLHSGELEATGVTTQKNSLGILIAICSLVLIWDWIESARSSEPRRTRLDRWLPPAILLLGAYLLHMCDSKTSMVCLVIGAVILLSPRMPFLKNRVGAVGVYVVAGTLAFYTLDTLFGVSDWILSSLGRDTSFTGRTDVWRELLALGTDPLLGTGFCSFWSDMSYQMRLPDWVAFSAHNGYIETYIDGGWIGVLFLVVLLLAVGLRMNAGLASGGNMALMRFAVLMVTLVGDFSESHFVRMSPLWFLFLLSAVDPKSLPQPRVSEETIEETAATRQGQSALSPSY
jgi:O-antigen ligase